MTVVMKTLPISHKAKSSNSFKFHKNTNKHLNNDNVTTKSTENCYVKLMFQVTKKTIFYRPVIKM